MKISQELQGLFSRLGVAKTFPKRFTLLHEGDVSRHAYFIETGCIRLWHNNDGADVSVKFFLPGELCASLQSMHREEPSKYELETITPCVVSMLDKSELEREAAETPGLKDYISSVMVHCLVNYQDLFVDRIAKAPEERYRALIEEDPAILDIVPLHYIASYLGITPVSLSRIRKKIALS
ncbi:Crp/Fnr family transcriptional regulator [Roseovarius sp. EL26]|uniref:Crp/Fnr family transcriptional regulator n=1 Tax=Roseovarius sp. EL26 TaxID=2126672 RepID=UPI000EA2473E|nr:Crp/Fnr family transcriptional regulator [Roseovarius sp. EL26]